MKFLLFLFLVVIFALLDPDIADRNQCGSMWILIRIHNSGQSVVFLSRSIVNVRYRVPNSILVICNFYRYRYGQHPNTHKFIQLPIPFAPYSEMSGRVNFHVYETFWSITSFFWLIVLVD